MQRYSNLFFSSTNVILVFLLLHIFFQWHKAKGSAAFFGGILVVLLGWPLIGKTSCSQSEAVVNSD